MSLIRRRPVKTIRIATAAQMLNESRTNFNRRIARGDIKLVDKQRVATQPRLVYEADVKRLMEAMGR